MDFIMVNLIAIMLVAIVMMAFFCTSYKRMLKREKKLIEEGKEVPEWMLRRKRCIKKYYAKFQAHLVAVYFMCAAFVCGVLLISALFNQVF